MAAVLVSGCGPPGPRALLAGQKLLERGQYAAAIEKLERAVALLPTNALAFEYLGLAYHQAGHPTEAEKAYLRALVIDPDLTEAHYNLGWLELDQNKLEPAKTHLTAYTLRRGNSPEGWLKLGAVQSRLGELAAGEKSFSEALRLKPQDPEALSGLGLIRVQRGRPVEAAQFFTAALKQQPDNAAALLNLAVVEQQYLKNVPAALQRYQEYLALKPTPEHAEAVQAIVRQIEMEVRPPTRSPGVTASVPEVHPPKPAVETARTPAKAPEPESARVVPSKSEAEPGRPNSKSEGEAAGANAPREATAKPQSTANSARPAAPNPPPASSAPASQTETTAATEAVKVPPEPVLKPAQDTSSSEPTATPAQPLVSTSGPPAKVASAKTAKRGFFARLNPLHLLSSDEHAPSSEENGGSRPGTQPGVRPPARYTYLSPPAPEAEGNRTEAEHAFAQGLQAHQAQRWSEAIAAYRRASKVDPTFFDPEYNLGLAATAAGKLPVALSAYEHALAIRPESLDARYNFALVLKQADYFVDAVKELERILSLYPNESRAHLALANLYAQQLHQPAKAREHYLKVLETDPHNPQAGAIRDWLVSNH